MGPQIVIFGTEFIQPVLIFQIALSFPHGSLQGSMHPFHLALSLWMADAAVNEPDSQLHDPYA
jgi:hypothetical protein